MGKTGPCNRDRPSNRCAAECWTAARTGDGIGSADCAAEKEVVSNFTEQQPIVLRCFDLMLEEYLARHSDKALRRSTVSSTRIEWNGDRKAGLCEIFPE